jgi:hypothetical protein
VYSGLASSKKSAAIATMPTMPATHEALKTKMGKVTMDELSVCQQTGRNL